jgi:hypothetical protein
VANVSGCTKLPQQQCFPAITDSLVKNGTIHNEDLFLLTLLDFLGEESQFDTEDLSSAEDGELRGEIVRPIARSEPPAAAAVRVDKFNNV